MTIASNEFENVDIVEDIFGIKVDSLMDFDIRDPIKRKALAKYLCIDEKDMFHIGHFNELTDSNIKYGDIYLDFLDFMSRPDNFWFTCKFLFNIDLHPFQIMILKEFWNRKFPMLIASRGASKTFLLGIYAILRAIFHQGAKIVLTAGSFRQSKLIFEVAANTFENSEIVKNMCAGLSDQGAKRGNDRHVLKIGKSQIIAVPTGSGDTIRGLRSNYTIVDEFLAINPDIFEVVIRAFGSVAASPIDRAKEMSLIDALNEYGKSSEAERLVESLGFGNQVIISSTAYFAFNHLYDYYQKYRKIIESKGDKNKLREIIPESQLENLDWKNYSIIRIPYNALPPGFMDKEMIAQAESLSHHSKFLAEYGAVFPKDSTGFFSRADIESCVAKHNVITQTGTIIQPFSPQLVGNPNKQHVIGIDPASEQDNFAIVVLEINDDHKKVVYCWTTNRKKLEESGKLKGKKQSFYNYCILKIRELIKKFPTQHVMLDAQGGGIPIMEGLHDESITPEGEPLIWPYIASDNDPFWWEKPNKLTDMREGLHILHMIQFSNAKLVSEANHLLKRDIEARNIIFPYLSDAEIASAMSLKGTDYGIDDCMMEIFELQDELSLVEYTITTSGREKWDTPEYISELGKKERLRKDRYTALLLANYAADIIMEGKKETTLTKRYYGKYVGSMQKGDSGGKMYIGRNSDKIQPGLYRVVRRH